MLHVDRHAASFQIITMQPAAISGNAAHLFMCRFSDLVLVTHILFTSSHWPISVLQLRGKFYYCLVAITSANDSEYIPVYPLAGFVGETLFKAKHVKEYLIMVDILEVCGTYIPEIRGSWSLGRPSICKLYRIWFPPLHSHFRTSRFPLHHSG